MKKVKVLAIVSALGTALLLFLFLNSLSQPGATATTSIIVAASDIPENTPITDSMIKMSEIPVEAVVAGALTDKLEIIGKIANTMIYSGEQLLSAKLISTGESGGETLAYAIEPGMRAISIAVDESSGLAYMLIPGNNVDIIAQFVNTTSNAVDGSTTDKKTYTTMILENITVLAVDNVFSKEGKVNSETQAYTTLTLQVTPEQAMELSAAQFDGQLRAILRSPVDEKITHQPSLTLGDVIKKAP